MVRYIILILICMSAFLALPVDVKAEDSIINVYYNEIEGVVNKKVFGNNFLGYDEASYRTNVPHSYVLMDYGAGAWDPIKKEPVKEIIQLAKDAGVSVLRFPGGDGTHYYDWKKAIGSERQHFLYGLDEFMRTVEDIGAEAIITVSYFTGTDQDAADLIEYLNAPDNGQNKWAAKRAENGHKEPYGVKYFEFGNEVYHGDHRAIDKVKPEEYAKRYILYSEAMKKVDPSIQFAAILGRGWWDSVILEKVGDIIDFVVVHTYPPHDPKLFRVLHSEDLFRVVLQSPVIDDDPLFSDTIELIKKITGRTDIPIAITEFNISAYGLSKKNDKKVYRHTLGNGLVTAEMLKIFMKPENKILMANNWHFSNSYWGMVRSASDYTKHNYKYPIKYIKRPNYYVYELYNKYFGDHLIKHDVQTELYDISEYEQYLKKDLIGRLRDKLGISGTANLLPEQWEIKQIKGVEARQAEGMLELEFDNPDSFNYYHSKKVVKVKPGKLYKLTGYIKTDNLKDAKGVMLEVMDAGPWRKGNTSSSTVRVKGTRDWRYVQTIYKPLPGTEFVKVLARRRGDTGPLSGKAFFRDVQLREYEAKFKRIPYLSVNSSKSKDGKIVYLMVLNKNMEDHMQTNIMIKDAPEIARAAAWVLNGPSVDATNEMDEQNVTIKPALIEFNEDRLRLML
nr:hypothetical protein [Candidatus Brocadiales bacterium]